MQRHARGYLYRRKHVLKDDIARNRDYSKWARGRQERLARIARDRREIELMLGARYEF